MLDTTSAAAESSPKALRGSSTLQRLPPRLVSIAVILPLPLSKMTPASALT